MSKVKNLYWNEISLLETVDYKESVTMYANYLHDDELYDLRRQYESWEDVPRERQLEYCEQLVKHYLDAERWDIWFGADLVHKKDSGANTYEYEFKPDGVVPLLESLVFKDVKNDADWLFEFKNDLRKRCENNMLEYFEGQIIDRWCF